jgi:hypothetical protein
MTRPDSSHGAGADYQLFHNLDAGRARLYAPGDRLVPGYAGSLGTTRAIAVSKLPEEIFDRHNRDDRPDAESAPELSMGDVVVMGDTTIGVERYGFTPVTIDPADLLTITYREAVGPPA